MQLTQQMKKLSIFHKIKHKLVTRNEWQLYLLVLPVIIYFIIIHYVPMYGITIAFKRYSISRGIMESPWVGMMYFERFFESPMFWKFIWNTVILSFYNLALMFPFPIVFSLLLNQTRSKKLIKFAQTTTFAPHFISMVVMVGMLYLFLSPTSGIVNTVIKSLGMDPVFFMAEEKLFRHVFVFSNVWQHTGYSAIIYFAALTSVDTGLYEAADIDGANKLQKIWFIDIPSIIPTVVTMLLLQVGRILNVDTQRTLLMQTATNLGTSEVIGTYVYKVGLINSQFSYSTAINLFQTVINLLLLVSVNTISKKLAEESLW